MNDLRYEKTKNNVIYTTKIEEIKNVECIDDICISTYVVDKETDKLFKAGTNYQSLYESMDNLTKFVVCELDCNKSLEKLNAYISEANTYIEMHQDDYKYDDEIANRKKAIETKQEYIALINKLVSENGNNPLLALTCLVEFDNEITQLFIDHKKDYEVFNTLELLNQETLITINKLGYESFDGYIKNETSSKVDLIGEFTYRIK